MDELVTLTHRPDLGKPENLLRLNACFLGHFLGFVMAIALRLRSIPLIPDS